jgi:putative aldouronate transport system substrate-binding protein
VKLFNLHLEKNWGETAEFDKYYNDSAAVWQLSPVKPFPPKKNLDAYRQLAEFERTGNDEQMGDEAKTIWKYIQSWRNEGQAGGWGWERIYGPQGSYSIIDGYDRNGQLLYDKFTGFPTPTMIDRESFLHDLQNEMFINIILGSPLEEFDRFVEQWRLLGGDRITQEVNEWYHSQK